MEDSVPWLFRKRLVRKMHFRNDRAEANLLIQEAVMELKYKKILYCTDFSDDADYAFLTALDMAEKYQAHLVVFHVLHSSYKYTRQVVDEQSEGGEEAFLSPELLDKGRAKTQREVWRQNGEFSEL